jgi:uncharacterized protein involved in tolerance to divalent cations
LVSQSSRRKSRFTSKRNPSIEQIEEISVVIKTSKLARVAFSRKLLMVFHNYFTPKENPHIVPASWVHLNKDLETCCNKHRLRHL